MKTIGIFFLMLQLCLQNAIAQVKLDADGKGDTYELINFVLAPGRDAVEDPDCSHTIFGRHIDEVFDTDLNINVFRFYIHKTPDDDRCKNSDRQRNEIKTYNLSPDNLKGIEGETVVYKWKFKLDVAFQASKSFTHIHQLKAVGGSEDKMPLITLTPRKGDPDQLELLHAESTSQVTLDKVDLLAFKGVWVSVTETVTYEESGKYEVSILKVDGGEELFSYSNSNIRTWKTNADFIRPKWGIYRSLNNSDDLRDETVLFANFSIEETDGSMAIDDYLLEKIALFPNPTTDAIAIKGLSNKNFDEVIIYNTLGKVVISSTIKKDTLIDVSFLKDGVYFLRLKNKKQSIKNMMFIKSSN